MHRGIPCALVFLRRMAKSEGRWREVCCCLARVGLKASINPSDCGWSEDVLIGPDALTQRVSLHVLTSEASNPKGFDEFAGELIDGEVRRHSTVEG